MVWDSDRERNKRAEERATSERASAPTVTSIAARDGRRATRPSEIESWRAQTEARAEEEGARRGGECPSFGPSLHPRAKGRNMRASESGLKFPARLFRLPRLPVRSRSWSRWLDESTHIGSRDPERDSELGPPAGERSRASGSWPSRRRGNHLEGRRRGDGQRRGGRGRAGCLSGERSEEARWK